jgi:hypothetical protein
MFLSIKTIWTNLNFLIHCTITTPYNTTKNRKIESLKNAQNDKIENVAGSV